MRQSLRSHLWNEVRRGRVRRLARIGLRAWAARNDRALPAALAGPLLATFAVTWRCPLLCAMCDLPLRAAGEIPDADVLRWVDALAALEPAGLGFTGGEPLLRGVTYDAIERSARCGLVTHLNTSGLPVTDAAAGRLASSGLASVNVSIDHDTAAEHDVLRRRAGAHEAALAAVSRLARARDRARTALRVQVVMALTAATLERVPALERRVRDAGGDALSLLPVHEFPHEAPTAGAPAVAAAPDRLPAALGGAALENSRRYLRGIAPFLAGGVTPGPCSAPRTALFVDPGGRLFACTPAATARRDGIPATPETLRAVWRSGALAATVPAGRCERCWWNCHRELDIALRRR